MAKEAVSTKDDRPSAESGERALAETMSEEEQLQRGMSFILLVFTCNSVT